MADAFTQSGAAVGFEWGPAGVAKLARARGAILAVKRGDAADIRLATELDVTDVVPLLVDGAFVAVTAQP